MSSPPVPERAGDGRDHVLAGGAPVERGDVAAEANDEDPVRHVNTCSQVVADDDDRQAPARAGARSARGPARSARHQAWLWLVEDEHARLRYRAGARDRHGLSLSAGQRSWTGARVLLSSVVTESDASTRARAVPWAVSPSDRLDMTHARLDESGA